MSKQSSPNDDASGPPRTYVSVYELVATFSGRERQLVQHVEEKDRRRLLEHLPEREGHGFIELGGLRGHEYIVHTKHLIRLNVLGYLPAVEFEAEVDMEDEEAFRQLEEREASDMAVILRFWVRGQTEPEIHWGVEYAAWCEIRHDLIEDSKFIEFEDEDAEHVLYGVDHLDAVEAIDPFYLKEDQVETLLKRHNDGVSLPPAAEGANPP